jgi:hypothetical protein
VLGAKNRSSGTHRNNKLEVSTMPFVKQLSCAVFIMILAGCTSVKVQPMGSEHQPELICLENNPEVIVAGFEEAVRERIESHGINTQMYSGPVPEECLYTIRYTALKNWDIGLYMHHAELYLSLDGQEIGRAVYHLRNKGGLALNKWQDVKTKMDPVVDQLLGK